MRRNEDGPYLNGFWEFPMIREGVSGEKIAERFEFEWGLSLRLKEVIPEVTHQITFRKLRFFPFIGELSSDFVPKPFQWIQIGARGFPVSAYIRKILRQVQDLKEGYEIL